MYNHPLPVLHCRPHLIIIKITNLGIYSIFNLIKFHIKVSLTPWENLAPIYPYLNSERRRDFSSLKLSQWRNRDSHENSCRICENEFLTKPESRCIKVPELIQFTSPNPRIYLILVYVPLPPVHVTGGFRFYLSPLSSPVSILYTLTLVILPNRLLIRSIKQRAVKAGLTIYWWVTTHHNLLCYGARVEAWMKRWSIRQE